MLKTHEVDIVVGCVWNIYAKMLGLYADFTLWLWDLICNVATVFVQWYMLYVYSGTGVKTWYMLTHIHLYAYLHSHADSCKSTYIQT